jgi:hypothetical protein
MKAKLKNKEIGPFNPIDQAVLMVDSTRPPTG